MAYDTYESTRDVFQRLDEIVLVRLEVVEASCVYPKTLSMKEHRKRALLEHSYHNLDTFVTAVNAAKRDPHIKRLGFSLSIPLILDSLVKLFDTALSEVDRESAPMLLSSNNCRAVLF